MKFIVKNSVDKDKLFKDVNNTLKVEKLCILKNFIIPKHKKLLII